MTTRQQRLDARQAREDREHAENTLILAGVTAGKSYAEIGLSFEPPRSTTWVFKRATKRLAPNPDGEGMIPIADLHPRRGKRSAPYSKAERPAGPRQTLTGRDHKPFERIDHG